MINQENRGVSGAINTGIRAMNSNWYKLMNADDILYPSLGTIGLPILSVVVVYHIWGYPGYGFGFGCTGFHGWSMLGGLYGSTTIGSSHFFIRHHTPPHTHCQTNQSALTHSNPPHQEAHGHDAEKPCFASLRCF